MLEASKALLELLGPFNKFFIKKRIFYYSQIKYFIFKDLKDLN